MSRTGRLPRLEFPAENETDAQAPQGGGSRVLAGVFGQVMHKIASGIVAATHFLRAILLALLRLRGLSHDDSPVDNVMSKSLARESP
jgi:hypothetical protein